MSDIGTHMRAALYDRYGPPEVLYTGRVPVPRIGDSEVLVRVRAASVNGGELGGRAGLAKMVTGRRFPQGTGIDFVGEVAAVDAAVTGLRPGTAVWGTLPHNRFGSIAEYVSVRPRQLARTPAGLDPVDAAALPGVGATALTALIGKARLRPGERLLVRGAAGGVGHVAVQLGVALGAHVTGLAGARNLDLVRELGAHEALDHRAVGPADLGTFDVVMDVVGTEHAAYRRLLARRGRMVSIAFDMRRPLPSLGYVLASAVHGPRRVRFFRVKATHDTLADLTRRVEDGQIRPVVDTVHPLEDVAAAHRALEAGGVRGKHVIRVA